VGVSGGHVRKKGRVEVDIVQGVNHLALMSELAVLLSVAGLLGKAVKGCSVELKYALLAQRRVFRVCFPCLFRRPDIV